MKRFILLNIIMLWFCLANAASIHMPFRTDDWFVNSGIPETVNPDTTGGTLVRNEEELKNALACAQPGDRIFLANGIWNNLDLLIRAKGTAEKPIHIAAQERGKVWIEGSSNIRISGEFLVFSGLVFRNGWSPTSSVISFRETSGVYANHCRLTGCVIDNFNNPERFATESWIDLYGKNNRIDHCSLIDKRSQGVTLTVHLVDELCQNNQHQVSHNFFGYRQKLGSNGGETIRIGTSKYSMALSKTNVFANYFEQTDGEAEIVSIKSCGNIIQNNTFNGCLGSVTLRHGNDNKVEGNFFFGNGKANTGGVRIINRNNQVINNYFYGLKGNRFSGSLVFMNGVPNSAINRYHQVDGAVVSGNTFINCDHIVFGAGSDEERTLPPVNSQMTDNFFYHDRYTGIFTVLDDINGIQFENNWIGKGISPVPGADMKTMYLKIEKNAHGIYVPVSADPVNMGCSLNKPLATRENSGADWYQAADPKIVFDSGSRVRVEPGLNTLAEAAGNSGPGDILLLGDGNYFNTKGIQVHVPLSVISDGKAVITSEKATMFVIENGGSLKLEGLQISGAQAPDNTGNAIIGSLKSSMNRNYKLIVEKCAVKDLDVNRSFHFFRAGKGTFADSVVIKNSTFENFSGHVIELDAEKEDLGIYNAEVVLVENSRFTDIQGSVIRLYRGGTDESTFGPVFKMDRCTLIHVGKMGNAAVFLQGVQDTEIDQCIFDKSGRLEIIRTVGEPQTRLVSNNFFPKEEIVTNDKELHLESKESYDPVQQNKK